MSLPNYLCQCVGFDKDDAWDVVEESGPRSAAEEYAERCDSACAGELWIEPLSDMQIIRVKMPDGQIAEYHVSMDYTKIFYVEKVKYAGV